MDLNKLYEKQAELDKYILEKHNTKMSKEELLDNTILALLVEVGELANTTRCFKHWSTKGMMDKDIVLDELADCLHFYLSIGNQLGYELDNNNIEYMNYHDNLTNEFKMIYYYTMLLDTAVYQSVNNKKEEYLGIGSSLITIAKRLKFTPIEIEQAYLKKHEENYKRQREGY